MLDCPCSSLPLPLWPMVASADGDGRRGALRGCFRVRGVKGKKRAGERGSKAPLTWLAGSTARRLGANAFSSTRPTALLASGSLSCGAAESVWSVGVCEAPPSNSAFLSCFLLALVPGPAPCALALEPSWRPARQQVRAAPTGKGGGAGRNNRPVPRCASRLLSPSPHLPPPASHLLHLLHPPSPRARKKERERVVGEKGPPSPSVRSARGSAGWLWGLSPCLTPFPPFRRLSLHERENLNLTSRRIHFLDAGGWVEAACGMTARQRRSEIQGGKFGGGRSVSIRPASTHKPRGGPTVGPPMKERAVIFGAWYKR